MFPFPLIFIFRFIFLCLFLSLLLLLLLSLPLSLSPSSSLYLSLSFSPSCDYSFSPREAEHAQQETRGTPHNRTLSKKRSASLYATCTTYTAGGNSPAGFPFSPARLQDKVTDPPFFITFSPLLLTFLHLSPLHFTPLHFPLHSTPLHTTSDHSRPLQTATFLFSSPLHVHPEY